MSESVLLARVQESVRFRFDLLQRSSRIPFSFIENDRLSAIISLKSFIGIFFIVSAIEIASNARKKNPRAILSTTAIASIIFLNIERVNVSDTENASRSIIPTKRAANVQETDIVFAIERINFLKYAPDTIIVSFVNTLESDFGKRSARMMVCKNDFAVRFFIPSTTESA